VIMMRSRCGITARRSGPFGSTSRDVSANQGLLPARPVAVARITAARPLRGNPAASALRDPQRLSGCGVSAKQSYKTMSTTSETATLVSSSAITHAISVLLENVRDAHHHDVVVINQRDGDWVRTAVSMSPLTSLRV
jgi:hypothetical protein